ncbi:hypothetical protein PIB30_119178 [Stylosanthes scabra]|uniref:Uncharacterized protein n=1 Tax=Stylosanthes scabra TaxID=79078 RepID=A0ABU6U2S4_9FABA|nr:hypothetical protein [Stylosanthes scabra]
MACVKWDVIQRPRSLGGLGVGDVELKNLALLFKWWWRFDKEECLLWSRVVKSCNTMEVGLMSVGGVSCGRDSGVRSDIVAAGKGNVDMLNLFQTSVEMIVGNGGRVRFWHECWLKEGVLKNRFSRLFALSNDKDYTVKDCGVWNGLTWVWTFTWRRSRRGWEDDSLKELMDILAHVGVRCNEEDSLRWTPCSSGEY